jgi:hypothetical protein
LEPIAPDELGLKITIIEGPDHTLKGRDDRTLVVRRMRLILVPLDHLLKPPETDRPAMASRNRRIAARAVDDEPNIGIGVRRVGA